MPLLPLETHRVTSQTTIYTLVNDYRHLNVLMALGSDNPWSLDLNTAVSILFGIVGIGVSLLNLYFAWEQLDHVRV